MRRFSSLLGALVLSAAVASPVIAGPRDNNSPGNGNGGPPDHAAVLDLDHPRRIPDQFIVVLEPGSNAHGLAQRMANRHGGDVLNVYEHALKGFALRVPEPAARGIANNPHVRYVEADKTITLDATQSPATWGLDRSDQRDLPLDDAYTYNFDGSGVHAYIIDTGIRSSHNDFGGRVSAGFTAINDGNGTEDCNGHGTHVAGSTGGNTWGIAKNVQLYAVRVLDCQGSGSTSGVVDGIDWVTANHQDPAVANMSLGGGASSSIDDAVNTSVSNGVFYAVAAGNEDTDACTKSPARAAEAYTVAASDDSDTRASFSNYGSCVDIFAPGVSITSAWIGSDSDTNTISGTSMASPHVAGAAALLLDEDGTLSPDDVKSLLTNNASTNKISGANGSPNRLLYTLNDGDGGGGGGGGDGSTELTNGDPVTVSGAEGDQLRFHMDVPSGASTLTFDMSGGSGDADLYVKYGSEPTLNDYDCRPYQWGNDESCSFSSPQSGTWHVMVHGYDSFSGVDLVGNHDGDDGGGGGGDTTVYAENFDDGSASGWNKSSNSNDLWRLADDCVSAASGSYTIAFSRASPDCDYDVGTAEGWARSPAIDLSGFSSATLSLNHYWDTESYNGNYDVLQIQVSSDDGSSWTTIQEYDTSDANPSNYVSEDLDVSSFISSTFRLRLRFDSVDSVGNDFPGWYVDDIEVTAN